MVQSQPVKNIIGKINGFKKRRPKVFWALVLILVIILFRQIFFKSEKINYQTATVTTGNLVETLSTTGTIKAEQYANLSFQSGGRLAFVNVKKGDVVKKGQAIAGLDSVILNASYQQALNNYRNYQASAESVLDSVKDNAGKETYAQKATRTAAEVARDNAYDSVKIAQSDLRNATIFAPFSGIMTELTPSFAGANVTPATASYILVNLDSVYFDSEISETDLPKVKIGQKVNIKLDAYPDEVIEGKVENIGIVAFTSSTGGNAYSLRINLSNNKNQKYKVGMGGDVEIILATFNNIVKVPAQALVYENEKNYIWIKENNRLKKREVIIGVSSDNETEIKSGIIDGEVVVSEPLINFKEGQKI